MDNNREKLKCLKELESKISYHEKLLHRLIEKRLILLSELLLTIRRGNGK